MVRILIVGKKKLGLSLLTAASKKMLRILDEYVLTSNPVEILSTSQLNVVLSSSLSVIGWLLIQ
jgi:hypothetical protein